MFLKSVFMKNEWKIMIFLLELELPPLPHYIVRTDSRPLFTLATKYQMLLVLHKGFVVFFVKL